MKTNSFKRGSIFLIAIWLLVMFGFFAVAIYKIVYSRINVSSRYKTSALSRYAAESLVYYLQNLLISDNSKFQSLYALSQMNQRVIGDVTCQYTLSDEGSRININNMYPLIYWPSFPDLIKDFLSRFILPCLNLLRLKKNYF